MRNVRIYKLMFFNEAVFFTREFDDLSKYYSFLTDYRARFNTPNIIYESFQAPKANFIHLF